MNKLTLAQAEEYQRRKAMLKTDAEFKELAREIRDRHGLTDQEALSVFSGVTDLLEIAKQEIERLKEQRTEALAALRVIEYYDFHPEATIRAKQAIQRIQEEGTTNGISKG